MYNKHTAFGILVSATLLLASCGGGKPDYKVSLKNDADSASYYFGYFNGKQTAAQGLDDINIDAVAKGWQDAKKNVKLEESDEQVGMFMQKYFLAAQTRMGEKNKKAGVEFLEANAKKAGVVTSPSGLQYKIVKEGSGVKPAKEDMVDVVYHGTLVDGTVFDSSKERGDTVNFNVGGVVPGFSEALTLMNEGSIWEIYIPSELGYGERAAGGQIKPNSTLIFEINLVKVKKQETVENKK
jgi:FKBP-type peptidyl-prolyl cis-trans isomerase FklB